MYLAESLWVVDDAILDPSISEDVDRYDSVLEDAGLMLVVDREDQSSDIWARSRRTNEAVMLKTKQNVLCLFS